MPADPPLTTESKIEVTTAMLDAGHEAWWRNMLHPAPDQRAAIDAHLTAIYRAMDAARAATGTVISMMDEVSNAETLDGQPISTVPRDGLPIWLRSIETRKWWVAEWNAAGDSWADEDGNPCEAGSGKIQVTGTWGSHGGWFQPNEVDAWKPLTDGERAVWDEALYQERYGNLPATDEPFFGKIRTERFGGCADAK